MLKRMAEKTEAADSQNPVFTFFRSMTKRNAVLSQYYFGNQS